MSNVTRIFYCKFETIVVHIRLCSVVQQNIFPLHWKFETTVVVPFAAEFLKDLQTEFQNWEAGLNSDQKPKSLWEELAVSSLYLTIHYCNCYC